MVESRRKNSSLPSLVLNNGERDDYGMKMNKVGDDDEASCCSTMVKSPLPSL